MPPRNEGYYYAAYALSALVYAAYAASIWWRARRLERTTPAGPTNDR